MREYPAQWCEDIGYFKLPWLVGGFGCDGLVGLADRGYGSASLRGDGRGFGLGKEGLDRVTEDVIDQDKRAACGSLVFLEQRNSALEYGFRGPCILLIGEDGQTKKDGCVGICDIERFIPVEAFDNLDA